MIDRQLGPLEFKRTAYGIRLYCPDYKVSVEVEDTVTDYLRARQYLYLVVNHVLQGTFRDCEEHFCREE